MDKKITLTITMCENKQYPNVQKFEMMNDLNILKRVSSDRKE